ncbi:hypothetical protein [Cupriavidus sp. UME77]|uniref:hypothetical protein n=1 Tax=Cupriavidus sp. UME77 TaxID=1862321 RepID=UPI0016003E28|nr:hypothetical protein [Cupriavidus sp. UME77]
MMQDKDARTESVTSMTQPTQGERATMRASSWRRQAVYRHPAGHHGAGEGGAGLAADYLCHGVRAALHAEQEPCPDTRIHAAGYRLSGTLLSICAAAIGRDDSGLPRQSPTLFASETDCTGPGGFGMPCIESDVGRSAAIDAVPLPPLRSSIRPGLDADQLPRRSAAYSALIPPEHCRRALLESESARTQVKPGDA